MGTSITSSRYARLLAAIAVLAVVVFAFGRGERAGELEVNPHSTTGGTAEFDVLSISWDESGLDGIPFGTDYEVAVNELSARGLELKVAEWSEVDGLAIPAIEILDSSSRSNVVLTILFTSRAEGGLGTVIIDGRVPTRLGLVVGEPFDLESARAELAGISAEPSAATHWSAVTDAGSRITIVTTGGDQAHVDSIPLRSPSWGW